MNIVEALERLAETIKDVLSEAVKKLANAIGRWREDRVYRFQKSDHRQSGALPVYNKHSDYLKRITVFMETPPHRMEGSLPR